MTIWLAGLVTAAALLMAGRRTPRDRLVDVGSATQAGPRSLHPPGRAATVLLAGVAGTAVAATQLPVGVPAAMVVVTALVTHGRAARRRSRFRESAGLATIEVTAGLAAELRAGRTGAQALAAVAPWSGPLQSCLSAAAAEVATGLPAADGLLLAAAVPGAEPLRQVAAAWRVTETTGGRLADVLDRLTESLDAECELRRELDSALAGPRATVVLLAGLPLLGLALGQGVGAHPLQLLVHRPLGWALLGGAVLLDLAGVAVMRRITGWATRW